VPTPTRDEVVQAALSVPDEDGVIVYDFEARKKLAERMPEDPPSEHSAFLIAFNVPLADSDPRRRAPLAPPSAPARGTQGATDEGVP
jgi:hypothetical protein